MGTIKDMLFFFIAIEKVAILKYVSEVAKGLKRRKKGECFLCLTDGPFTSVKDQVALRWEMHHLLGLIIGSPSSQWCTVTVWGT